MSDEIQRLNEAVDVFAARMKEKLSHKYAQGMKGWDNISPDNQQLLYDKFINHVESQCNGHDEWVDLANFCMFLDRINRIAAYEQ